MTTGRRSWPQVANNVNANASAATARVVATIVHSARAPVGQMTPCRIVIHQLAFGRLIIFADTGELFTETVGVLISQKAVTDIPANATCDEFRLRFRSFFGWSSISTSPDVL